MHLTNICSKHRKIWTLLSNASWLSVMSSYLCCHSNMLWFTNRRLLAHVKNVFCRTKTVHLQYVHKVYMHHWKLSPEVLYKKHPAKQFHVKVKYTEEWKNTKPRVQCWTKIKYENLYLSYVMYGLYYSQTWTAKITDAGITKKPMQFVRFHAHHLNL